MAGGMIIPAGGGNPERRVTSVAELVTMGYTAFSQEALVEAFGESGYTDFVKAVAQAKLGSTSWDGTLKNYPGGDSVGMY